MDFKEVLTVIGVMQMQGKDRPHSGLLPFGYRVQHGVIAPRVAAQDAFDPQINPFQHAPFFNRLDHIVRTGRLVPAFVGTQQGRKRPLVKPDGKDKHFFQQLLHGAVILA